VTPLGVAEFALRLQVLRSASAYAAYLVASDSIDEALADLHDELGALDPVAGISRVVATSASSLVDAIDGGTAELLVIDARALSADDWATLDRRRSAIAHRGVLVFVTTSTSFDSLMQHAPNLASWLAGTVFAAPDHEPADQALRERRLAALRQWAAQTDEEIVAAAVAGTLPRDPEYAEWLVLLGRGDLLDARAP
jgi:hypothetical protein